MASPNASTYIPLMKRMLGAFLALWFVAGVVGAETHQCPQHDQLPGSASAPAERHDGHGEHSGTQDHDCTCPQVCSTSGIGVALPVVATRAITFVPPTTHPTVTTVYIAALPAPPPHLLPFALAPPHALA
jgi:hypothetical protein